LTTKLHSLYVEEPGVGVGNFEKAGVGVGYLPPTPQSYFLGLNVKQQKHFQLLLNLKKDVKT